MKNSSPTINATTFRTALLNWYKTNQRPMPWRNTTDAYPIWLSEIMLQQTTVATVIPYFEHFMTAFPTIADLAAAEEQTVLHHWQGLGYYSRARNLHKCARMVSDLYAGNFPSTHAELLKLPGIGDYTANAILAFAFNQPAAVLDGNVERVLTRLTANSTPLPQAKPSLKQLATTLAAPNYSRLYNNAIMELGATLCTPKNPLCLTCPVQSMCAGKNNPTAYPVKAPKKAKPHKTGHVYVIEDTHGALYLQQRPSKGLLASLWEFPHVGWEKTQFIPPDTVKKQGTFKHVFTHFSLELTVYTAKIDQPHPIQNAYTKDNLPPLPTLMRKVLENI